MTRDDRHELDPTLAAPPETVEATENEQVPASRPSWHGAPSARYKLETELGRGGMGEVVSARDEQIGRSVAIKRLRAASTPETEARFLREARIQGRLEHPAIVPVHELGRDDRGQPYFAMKQLSGKTLAEVLDQPAGERTFTRNQILRALIDVCLAVHFAHERGVVHRDLKPANIMLGDYGEVYVLDWGIARVLADLKGENRFGDINTIDTYGDGQTLVGQLLGTPGYMSPEQISGEEEIDARTDVFALGGILFEVLVGKPLLPRGKEALSATIAGAAEARAKREVEIAPELQAACISATQLGRAERMATARMLADKLQSYLDGDRDVSMRRRLAEVELGTAKQALARSNSVDDRRVALRAASRALALAPDTQEPAQLVGKLMIEPPSTVPEEVDAEVRSIERKALANTATQGNRALFVIMAFIPILWAGGIDSLWFPIALPVLAAIVWWGTWVQIKRDRAWGIQVSMIANMVIVAMFARLVSPFLVAPAIGALMATLFALHRASGRAALVGLGFGLAILGPWLLELAGVVPPTLRFTATELVIDPSGSHVVESVLMPMLGFYVVATMGVAIAMSRSLATVHHESQRQLQLQAWQLRQLVPDAR